MKDTGWSQITEGEIQEENSGRSTGGEGSFLHLPLLLLPNILLLVLEEDAGDGLCFPANSIPPTFLALPCACSLPTAGQRLGLAGTARGDTQHLLPAPRSSLGARKGEPLSRARDSRCFSRGLGEAEPGGCCCLTSAKLCTTGPPGLHTGN